MKNLFQFKLENLQKIIGGTSYSEEQEIRNRNNVQNPVRALYS
ncbi:MAG: hypothetical protein AAFQ94_13085 [Bacteroidota bacterium]